MLLDTNRGNYHLIPNDLFEIISKEIIDFDELNNLYANSKKILSQYKKFLLSNELIYQVEGNENLLPKIDTNWEVPFEITNMIIDIGDYSFNLVKFSSEIGILGVQSLQIRIFDTSYIDKAINLVSALCETNRSNRLTDIQIIMTLTGKDLKEDIIKIRTFTKNPFISSIDVFNTEKCNVSILETESKVNVFDKIVTSEKHCGEISGNINYINQNIIFESMQFNSCLNCKMSVDKNGNIKNCPSMNEKFGNLMSDSLLNIVDEKFQTKWHIKKDDIKICKDCEYRYICTDCRAYIEEPENIFSKPLKCGYNPYTNEYVDWETDINKSNTIKYYDL